MARVGDGRRVRKGKVCLRRRLHAMGISGSYLISLYDSDPCMAYTRLAGREELSRLRSIVICDVSNLSLGAW